MRWHSWTRAYARTAKGHGNHQASNYKFLQQQ